MRKPFIAGNWKLNKTADEAEEFIKSFLPLVQGVKDVEIGIAPQYLAIPALVAASRGSNVGIGSQDNYWEASGAFTGEVSAEMIKSAGCIYAIIGHSERRQFFGETNATVNQKLKAALAAGLHPIVCIGESLAERESGITEKVCEDHLRGGLAGLESAQMQTITIAYEPVWAIGTGKTATPEQAQEVHAFCRNLLEDMFSAEVAAATRIQYGGSVKPDNVKDLMAQTDIDGALVGGASLKPDSFAALVNFNK
ncbi:MAG: triose-phosphate isomerase [Planctomycetes bacterium]|nr:triose-phosphate isomerase [Planctomycetota bacterium]